MAESDATAFARSDADNFLLDDVDQSELRMTDSSRQLPRRLGSVRVPLGV
jgi:hypothetical protein